MESRRSNYSILKEISPGCSLEGLMLKLKLQYFGYLTHWNWFIGKDPDAGKDWGQKGTEDEMVRRHHWLKRHGFGWTLGVGDGQGGLMCCGSWGRRVRHDWATELNWTEQLSLLLSKMLPPWKKTMANLNSVLKSGDITLLTKVRIVKAMVFQ